MCFYNKIITIGHVEEYDDRMLILVYVPVPIKLAKKTLPFITIWYRTYRNNLGYRTVPVPRGYHACTGPVFANLLRSLGIDSQPVRIDSSEQNEPCLCIVSVRFVCCIHIGSTESTYVPKVLVFVRFHEILTPLFYFPFENNKESILCCDQSPPPPSPAISNYKETNVLTAPYQIISK
jgi:hypothetical protein